ncbi:MAG: PH domain-containing protein [Betaproteobacteria bacterium]|nr:PH domain-containing protein [Betaproteobacteria bacterium]
MSYIDRHLLSQERVVHRARLSRTVFARPALLLLAAAGLPLLGGAAIGLGALLALIALGYAVAAWARYAGSEFAVTDKRVIMKIGLIRRNSLEILLNRVESLIVEQGVWGRLFGFGSVWIVGTGGTRDPFHRIADPLEFRRAVQEQLVARGS